MRLNEIYDDYQETPVRLNVELDEPKTGRGIQIVLDVTNIQGSDMGVEDFTLEIAEPFEFAGRQYQVGQEFPQELYQFVVLPDGEDLASYAMDEIHKSKRF